MSFNKAYELPDKPGDDELILTWEQGYRNLKVYFQGQVIDQIENPTLIKKGYAKEIPSLGLLELRFSSKPMVIDVSVDGIRSPTNGHYHKDLSVPGMIFWTLFGLSVIGSTLEAATYGLETVIGITITGLNVFFTLIYLVAAIFSQKNQAWAYYLGTFTFVFTTILVAAGNILLGNMYIIIQIAIRIAILIALFKHFKTALNMKNINLENQSNDLLDV